MDTKSHSNVVIYCAHLVVLVILGGCFQQKTVVYIPPDKRKSIQVDVHQEKEVSKKKIVSQEKEKNSGLKSWYNEWKGVRYRKGGVSRKGIDCSAFTQLTYKELYDVTLPRTVREQARKGKSVSKNRLRRGDLVFFKIGVFSRHVGIYFEGDRFIHVSRSKGVIMSNLTEPYWKKRYWRAKRI